MNGPDQMHDQKVQVANEILQYLIDNPKAQDTFKGILDWWLLERTIQRQKRLVEDALKMLVEEGLVLEHERSDSQISYKINRRKRQKIIARLQGKS